MTRADFDARADEPCHACGASVILEDNPNNGATQVVCSSGICRLARRPWVQVINIKKTTKMTRRPLPNGETLDSIWQRFGDRCVLCAAPKHFLVRVGIGRQVHHVVPYAAEGHRGPLVPICIHCHAVANDRQRLHWFYRRIVLGARSSDDDDGQGISGADDIEPSVVLPGGQDVNSPPV